MMMRMQMKLAEKWVAHFELEWSSVETWSLFLTILLVLQNKKAKITSDSEDDVEPAEEGQKSGDEANDLKTVEETDEQVAIQDEGQPEEGAVVPEMSDSDSDSGVNKGRE